MTSPWAALKDRLKPAAPPPEALTVQQLMSELDMKRTCVDTHTRNLVKEGFLREGKFIKAGRWQTFYWPAKGVKHGKSKSL